MVLVSDEENNVSTTYNLRTTDELFDDQQNIVYPILRVKRINKPKDNERWEVTSGDEVVVVIKRSSLTNGDAALLYSADGIKFLLDQVKSGNRSAVKIKESLQEYRRLMKKEKVDR
jgi:hypothetical protein